MGKYSEFGRRLDSLARGIFSDFEKAERDFNRAKIARESHPFKPGSIGATSEYQIEALKRETAFQEATANIEKARKKMRDALTEARELRQELLEELKADLSIDPASLDSKTVEILNSGICRPEELAQLFAKSEGNVATQRFIGGFAKKCANTEGISANDRAVCEMVAAAAAELFPENHAALRNLDFGISVLEKCEKNPAMTAYWGSLTEKPLSEM